MCKKVIIGALLGGMVLLLWQFAVRELLGVYDDAFVKLEDSAAVEAILKENLTGSGMIKIPLPEPGNTDAEAKAMEKLTTGFSLFGAVNLAGGNSFGTALGIQFALNVLASAVLMFVLLAANPPTLGSRIALGALFRDVCGADRIDPELELGGGQFHLHRQTDWRADRRLGVGRPGLGQGHGQV